uniref:DNA/RNA polymerases superfamily protein n=1 Tax=Tanacetum cinerariifolium TaxID=118510 RepID=A0A6L2J7N2_TANCI|nr:DNA/RNA polymerases superfamily protein [Tanacetum cinerariifolium]
MSMTIRSSVTDKILATPGEASKVENTIAEMLCGLDQLIERKEDGCMHFIWVPLIGDVRTLIMDEAHASRLKDGELARLYIDEIVAGHGVPVSIILDRDGRFTSRVLENITESLRDAIGYEYGLSSSDGWTKSPVLWVKTGESRLIGTELVQETTDKVVLVKEKLKATRHCQKSYADNRRKLLEFEVEDQVLLKVSPWKGVKYLADANMHVHLDEIKVDKTLRFVKELVEIIDREVKSLKHSRILIVKVHWNSIRGHEDFIKTNGEELKSLVEMRDGLSLSAKTKVANPALMVPLEGRAQQSHYRVIVKKMKKV